jgi:hypothetical protein
MVKPILESMYSMRSEMVPCFIGAPGIGKTQGIYEFAKEQGVKVVTFILSNTVPSEISGIRMPDKDTKKLEVFDDARMASLEDGDILFFDEILEAPPMLWSACLTLIQDRIMASGNKLPDVFIVAASNPVPSPASIPASIRDRFQFIELQFDPDHWCKWFKESYGIDMDSKLVKRIQGDSTIYNILTPRRVIKLYEYAVANKDDLETVKAVIEDMFDLNIFTAILSMATSNPSIKIKLKNALLEIDPDMILPPSFASMSMKDIALHLQSMNNWEEISKVLATIDAED